MKRIVATLALVALGTTGLSATAEAKAKAAKRTAPPTTQTAANGTPQRSSTVPPGLAKHLLDPNHGISRALVATEGSNSRLQDHPDSP